MSMPPHLSEINGPLIDFTFFVLLGKPYLATVCSMALLTCSSDLMSQTNGKACPPARTISSAALKIVPGNY
jgi:hypothetical protein